MPYSQANRPLQIKTPLGPDKLFVVSVTGQEGLSQLYSFELACLAENATDVAFDKLLGQSITVQLKNDMAGSTVRHINGICSRISQGERDKEFTTYRLHIVPKFWLLSKKVQSRIFQQLSVPDILKKVLTGLDVDWKIQGTFEKRDYCVQYRESDFNFASRLMEEEGIYYFFTHADGSHKMVVANTPQGHVAAANGPETVNYQDADAAQAALEVVFDWEKIQEIRSGKTVLWDYCFEKPTSHLDATKPILATVAVGTVTHKLNVANDTLEVYDYPGEYAQRFDGITPGGGDRASDIEKIATDNARTAGIRMQEETTPAIELVGGSNCVHFTSGHKFKLAKHFNANGEYVFTSVQHSARLTGAYRAGEDVNYSYQNSFACIPMALPYRPPRRAPKPVVQGTQTAVVVGPSGEEIYTDKYGRVKVQFHWDRDGKKDADSACWMRVATVWASKQWGAIHIPRISMEVIVAFEEGDPDQPIIVGCVYNADNMPPYTLPDNRTQSGIKSRSSLKGEAEHFNEFRFEDKKGEEYVYLRAEKDHICAVENDEIKWVGHDKWIEVDNDEETTIKNNRTETIKEGNEKLTIEKGNREDTITKGNDTLKIDTGNREVVIAKGNDTLKIDTGNRETKIAKGNLTIKCDLGKIEIEAMQSIELKVGSNSIKIEQSGITIKGVQVKAEGQAMLEAKSPLTTVKGDGVLTLKGGVTMVN